ncbi:hypothetical protein [Streptomyces sp. NPDC048612]|uniref:hypothetical protein n=1 Tax=Streptomyces sp. NPDC048612 TaxID=3365579 RepID=UPI0037228E97
MLAHLAQRFKVDKEPLVTEALCYLAQHYESVRTTLAELAERGRHDRTVTSAVRFRPEARSDGDSARPDLAGLARNTTLVLIEGKFGSGLTDHQPVTYLERIAPGGTLLLVCPSWRVPHLLEAATRKAAEAGFAVRGAPVKDPEGIHWHALTEGRHLAAVSWVDLLRLLEVRGAPDEQELPQEIRQVHALVRRFEGMLVEWRRDQLLAAEFGDLFEMGCAAAQQAVEVLGSLVGQALAPKWVRAGNHNYRGHAEWAGHRLVIGFAPADWGRPSPSPLYFALSKHHVPETGRQALYDVYLRVMKDIDARLRHDFDGRGFEACAWEETYWWGPLPLAFGVSEQEWHSDLRATIARILGQMTDSLAPLPIGEAKD